MNQGIFGISRTLRLTFTPAVNVSIASTSTYEQQQVAATWNLGMVPIGSVVVGEFTWAADAGGVQSIHQVRLGHPGSYTVLFNFQDSSASGKASTQRLVLHRIDKSQWAYSVHMLRNFSGGSQNVEAHYANRGVADMSVNGNRMLLSPTKAYSSSTPGAATGQLYLGRIWVAE